LANVGTSGDSEVDQSLLSDLPNGLVEKLEVSWNLIDVLNRSIIGNQLVLDRWYPKIDFDQILDQVFVDTNKFTCENSSGVHIGSEWLETFIVSKDLGGRGSWHWCNE